MENKMDSSVEQKLKILFDYQNFENNAELLKMKRQSEESFAYALKEEELAFVNAAGPTISGNIGRMDSVFEASDNVRLEKERNHKIR